jgi:hypothetical protein
MLKLFVTVFAEMLDIANFLKLKTPTPFRTLDLLLPSPLCYQHHCQLVRELTLAAAKGLSKSLSSLSLPPT